MSMKAIVIDGSPGIEHLKLIERPIPEPRYREVLLKMRAASLNYRDLEVVRGSYEPRFPLPLVPLSDGVGEVVAVGEGVTRVKLGERVAGTFWQGMYGEGEIADTTTRLGGPLDGVLTEYLRLGEDGVVSVPAHLTDEEAATLPCAALTAWQALVTEGRLKAGDTVLAQGTGGVSIFALQFGVIFGAGVIVTSSSDAKLERARALGAIGTINYVHTPQWHFEVNKLTGGRGVDHVIEVGGPTTMTQSLEAMRPGGRISIIGYLGGRQGTVDPGHFLRRSAKVQGIRVGSRASFEAMNRAIALNRMRPVIDRTFAWTEIAAALRHLESGAHFGKVVVRF